MFRRLEEFFEQRELRLNTEENKRIECKAKGDKILEEIKDIEKKVSDHPRFGLLMKLYVELCGQVYNEHGGLMGEEYRKSWKRYGFKGLLLGKYECDEEYRCGIYF